MDVQELPCLAPITSHKLIKKTNIIISLAKWHGYRQTLFPRADLRPPGQTYAPIHLECVT